MIQALTLAIALLASPPQGLEWNQVTKKSKESISGILMWGEQGGKPKFLIAHDNKGADDMKMSWLTASGPGGYKFVKVDITDPQKLASDTQGAPLYKDLESLCRVPGMPNHVMAIGDRGPAQGWVYLFKVNSNKAEIVKAFQVPNVLGDSDYEALDVVKLGDKIVAVWADRGTSTRPGWLSVAELKLNSANPIGSTVRQLAPVPWPRYADARSISDLRVTPSGNVYISSAVDSGDDGPFDSAVYIVGRAVAAEGEPTLTLNENPIAIAHTPGYKIEAIDFDPTGRKLVFASDDENMGASIAWFQK